MNLGEGYAAGKPADVLTALAFETSQRMGSGFMTFDSTVTLGALLNALVLVIGFAVAFTRIGGRIDLLAQRVTVIEEMLKAQRDVSERLAVIETRQATHGSMIANVQTEIQDVRRGRGFIRDRASGGIDGEYP